jgi:hypothetical protein
MYNLKKQINSAKQAHTNLNVRTAHYNTWVKLTAHSIQDLKNTYEQSEITKNTSRYAQHILNTRHSYGTIDETMEIVKRAKKRKIHGYSQQILHILFPPTNHSSK